MKLKLGIFFFIMITTRNVFSQDIIPADRRIDWNPGIPSGIPNYPAGVNVYDYGAKGDGIEDDTQAIIDAIAACADYHAVLMPAGSYRLTLRIYIRKPIVIRGEGIDQTFIIFEGRPDGEGGYDPAHFWIGDYSQGAVTNVLGGCDKGSSIMTVSDPSGFSVGDLVEIRQTNDPDVMTRPELWYTITDPNDPNYYRGWTWGDHPDYPERNWGKDAVGQFLTIEAINGNTITFHRPLYYQYNLIYNPYITRYTDPTLNAGVEDLHINLVYNCNGYYGNVQIYGSAYCWVRNIRCYKCSRSHVGIELGLGCEVRDCYFEDSHCFAGGWGYGTNLGQRATDCLIENNIFYKYHAGMITAVGVSGNVFGYNFAIKPIDDTGEFAVMHNGMSAHGHHANMNLFEGNFCVGAWLDAYWGSNANYVFLRNTMYRPDGYATSNIPAVVDENNPYMSFLGNILHHENSPERGMVWRTYQNGDYYTDPNFTMNTLIRHGNYDYMSENTYWEPDIDNHDLPNSYYLSGKPDYFSNAPWGDTPWPNTGPELLHAMILPAQQRFCDLNGITPPAAPTGLSAVAENNSITLSWTDNSIDEQGFRIEQSMDGNHFSRIEVTMADSSHYSVTGLTPWTTYTYRVCSFDDIPGNSAYSNTASAITQEAVPAELAAWFPYNGDANDASSNDYHGEVHGAVISSGHSGQSYAFDGFDDYIVSDGWDPDGWGPVTSPVHGNNQAFTVTAWINPADSDGNNWVVSDNSTWGDFVFGVHDSRPFIRYFCNLIEGGYQRYMLEAVETAIVETGVFSHIAASYDPLNNIVRLYLNGQQVAVDRVNHPLGPVSFDHLFVGCGGYSTGVIEYFEGMIDDVRIYASILSQAQIQNLAETDVELQIKIFLEGAYHSGIMVTDLQTGNHIPLESPYDATTVSSIPADVVDWVLVEIWSHVDGSGDNYSKSVFVRQDGMVLDINGSDYISITAPEGNYYITVRHRNHLSVMSDVPVYLSAN